MFFIPRKTTIAPSTNSYLETRAFLLSKDTIIGKTNSVLCINDPDMAHRYCINFNVKYGNVTPTSNKFRVSFRLPKYISPRLLKVKGFVSNRLTTSISLTDCNVTGKLVSCNFDAQLLGEWEILDFTILLSKNSSSSFLGDSASDALYQNLNEMSKKSSPWCLFLTSIQINADVIREVPLVLIMDKLSNPIFVAFGTDTSLIRTHKIILCPGRFRPAWNLFEKIYKTSSETSPMIMYTYADRRQDSFEFYNEKTPMKQIESASVECSVCFETIPSIFSSVVQCGGTSTNTMCQTCVDKITYNKNPNQRRCPFCRYHNFGEHRTFRKVQLSQDIVQAISTPIEIDVENRQLTGLHLMWGYKKNEKKEF